MYICCCSFQLCWTRIPNHQVSVWLRENGVPWLEKEWKPVVHLACLCQSVLAGDRRAKVIHYLMGNYALCRESRWSDAGHMLIWNQFLLLICEFYDCHIMEPLNACLIRGSLTNLQMPQGDHRTIIREGQTESWPALYTSAWFHSCLNAVLPCRITAFVNGLKSLS